MVSLKKIYTERLFVRLQPDGEHVCLTYSEYDMQIVFGRTTLDRYVERKRNRTPQQADDRMVFYAIYIFVY